MCFISIIFVLIFGSSGCERKTLVEIGTENQVLYFSNATDITGIDPHGTNGMPEAQVITAVFEGLVAKHPETLDVIPATADKWEVSDDGMTYIFHIRENAKWSNGDPVTAHDFVNSWLRGLMPALANETVTSLFVLKMLKNFTKKKLLMFRKWGLKL
ncbi:MAG: hypothetical protein IPK77_00840 [Cellvibrio sp.]|nr:hypothetical protein [Cellvibrio sp.]